MKNELKTIKLYASCFSKELKAFKAKGNYSDEVSAIYDFFVSEEKKPDFNQKMKIVDIVDCIKNKTGFGERVLLYAKLYSKDFVEYLSLYGKSESDEKFVDVARFYLHDENKNRSNGLFNKRFNEVDRQIERQEIIFQLEEHDLPDKWFCCACGSQLVRDGRLVSSDKRLLDENQHKIKCHNCGHVVDF